MSPKLRPPPLGADPHEDWRLRQKPQEVKPLPKPEVKPGLLEKVCKGTALSRTWDELGHNEKLHQGVEAGGFPQIKRPER